MKMKLNVKSDFETIVQAFMKVVTAHPLYFLFISIINVSLGFVLALSTLALDMFFSNIGRFIAGDIVLTGIAGSFILLIISILANPVLNGINTVFALDYERKVIGKLEKSFNEKCGTQRAYDFEETHFLDNINKAQAGVKNTVSLVMSIVDAMLVYIPYFIIIGVYLFRLKPSLLIIIVLFSVPVLFSQMFKSSLYAKLEDRVAPLRRECEHYGECIIDKDKFKETRLLGAFDFFINKYKTRIQNLNEELITTQVKSIKIELIFKLPVLIGHILTLLLLVKYLVEGSITIGNFGAILASVGMLISMIEQMVYYVIGNSMKQIGSVGNYLNFMKTKESLGNQITYNKAPVIELKGVSFAYPGSNQDAVSNISLEIRAEETIAIVGGNGAGKSTLMNLISGIYKPSVGSVNYNGQDTKTLDSNSLMKNISSVFQDFQRYKMTLYENIAISDPLMSPTDEHLEMIFNKTDLDANSKNFPNGMNTMLSRDFDGVDLSGGQWQKIAIARGLYKPHSIIILDEPTASIDPVEESNLFTKFIELSKGKTSFIVTHRLALSKFADRIVVMDQGRVVQIGNHKELIHVKGKYQELYHSQSKWYVETKAPCQKKFPVVE